MLRTVALVLAVLPTSTAFQQEAPVPVDPARSRSNLAERHLALGGHDPVAYFPEGGAAPRKGNKDLTVEYRGAQYRFASRANRELFLTRPSDFAPAFGGWCAYAMADGERVEVDPKSFLVEDGSLLVFYDGLFADTRKSWLAEGPDELRAKADRAWLAYAGEPRRRDLAGWAHTDGLALGGYDPVAYRQPADRGAGDDGASDDGAGDDAKEAVQRAVLGDARFAARERGLTYHFASEANRLAFLVNPGHFEPAFGGHDALALAAGEVRAGAPQHFGFLADGRLVLLGPAVEGAPSPEETWNRERDRLAPLAKAAFEAHLAALEAARAPAASGG
jgi:YHS domain-containing protein